MVLYLGNIPKKYHFLNFLSASLIRHRGPWIFYADGMFSSQIDIGAAALEAATK